MNMKEIWLHSLRNERRITRETIANMKDGDVQVRPTEEQRAFGDQALHIISCQHTLLGAFQGKGFQWDLGYTIEKYATLKAILTAFDSMHEASVAFYESQAPEWFDGSVQTPWAGAQPVVQEMIGFLAHESHHRGQMVAYLRLKGMEPARY